MAKTIGCSDLNQDCTFRIIADDGQEDEMVDMTTAHAVAHHAELVPDEASFRSAIRSEIKSLMAQAHMSPREIAEI